MQRRPRVLGGVERLEGRELLAIVETPVPLDAAAALVIDEVPRRCVTDTETFRAPRPDRVADFGDYYWYFEETIGLDRSRDQFVLAFTSAGAREEALNTWLARDGRLYGFEIGTVLNDTTVLLQRKRTRVGPTIEGILTSDLLNVAWKAPVFVARSSGLREIPTNEIAIALHVSPDAFMERFPGLFSARRAIFENQWVFTVAQGGGLATLELANALHLDPQVRWASPNFLSEIRFGQFDVPNASGFSQPGACGQQVIDVIYLRPPHRATVQRVHGIRREGAPPHAAGLVLAGVLSRSASSERATPDRASGDGVIQARRGIKNGASTNALPVDAVICAWTDRHPNP